MIYFGCKTCLQNCLQRVREEGESRASQGLAQGVQVRSPRRFDFEVTQTNGGRGTGVSGSTVLYTGVLYIVHVLCVLTRPYAAVSCRQLHKQGPQQSVNRQHGITLVFRLRKVYCYTVCFIRGNSYSTCKSFMGILITVLYGFVNGSGT